MVAAPSGGWPVERSMAAVTRWWAELGWATHGSKLQTQLYVNRRPAVLSGKVLEALPALKARNPQLEWVAPLENPKVGEKAFAEPRDGAMLTALGLKHLASALARFWPARGPVWDALAIIRFDDGTNGALLAEGKNYPREMYSGGTGAGKSGSPAAAASRRRIELAIAWTQGRLGVPLDVRRWLDPLDPARPGSSLYRRLTGSRTSFGYGAEASTPGSATCSSLTTRSISPPAAPPGTRASSRPNASSASPGSSFPSRATLTSRRSTSAMCSASLRAIRSAAAPLCSRSEPAPEVRL